MIKFALIGCGRISPNHVVAAQKNNLEIVAICDNVEECMENHVLRFGLGKKTKCYTDYKKMIVDEKPDLVAIATESGKHAEIALFCLGKNCNIIVEKPIALSIGDAIKIEEMAKKKDLVCCACHQNRFNKAIQKIRQAVDMKRFGKMLYGTAQIRWARDHEYYERAEWRGTWLQDGGALMNQCIHDIDLLRWMMGDSVDEVYAITDRMTHDYIEAEDFGAALVRFSNGAYGIIEGTVNVYPRNLEETLCLFGEKGTVKAGGEAVNIIEEWRFADHMDLPEDIIKQFSDAPPNIYGFGHSVLYADVVQAIENHRAPYVDAAAGKRALELVLAIYKSAYERKAVKLPLEDCGTTDFIGRF